MRDVTCASAEEARLPRDALVHFYLDLDLGRWTEWAAGRDAARDARRKARVAAAFYAGVRPLETRDSGRWQPS